MVLWGTTVLGNLHATHQTILHIFLLLPLFVCFLVCVCIDLQIQIYHFFERI